MVTFRFIAPPGYTPTLSIYRADTSVLLGSAVATEGVPGHYSAAINVGAYSGAVLAAIVNPTGAMYGNTSDGQLRDEPAAEVATTVNVLPLNTTLQSRVSGSTIEVFAHAATVVALGITDAAGDPVDLEELTLEFVVESLRSRTDKLVIADGELGRTGSTLNVTIPKSAANQLGQKKWALWDKTAEDVLAHGLLIVNYAPKADD